MLLCYQIIPKVPSPFRFFLISSIALPGFVDRPFDPVVSYYRDTKVDRPSMKHKGRSHLTQKVRRR
ncbi:hypothetical protein QT971_17490 [Microcoleus sp. herbarium19]|uniref:hypothetical protein n=1 Tax=unclassified Microcoleus TaxID=2642155 RepID=UPI002FD3EC70